MTPALPQVSTVLHQEIIAHADSINDREVGGILIGSFTQDGTVVEAILPALKAENSRANVTFTHEVWSDALATIDRDFPDLRIVGWYHSHPGFGIFLSAYDLFIHENFFADPGMVAFVYDPQSRDEGWFGWEEGDVVRLDAPMPLAVEAGAAPSEQFFTRRFAAVALVTLLGGGLIGWVLAADTRRPSPSRPSVAQVQPRKPSVATTRAPTQERETITYRVRKGDALEAIAQRYVNWKVAYPKILAANPGLDPNRLEPGQRIQIPSSLELLEDG